MDHPPAPVGSSRDSPAPSKRARDYGEELKGLSPVADEGSPEESLLAFKKRRLAYDGDASGSDSESLDDGEIVESPSASHVASLLNTALPPGTHLGPEPSNTLNVLTEASPALLGSKQDSSRISEASNDKNSGGGKENRDTSLVPSNHIPPSLPGWNHGIPLGTRTTFATKPAISSLRTSPTAVTIPDQDQDQQTIKEKKRVRSRDRVTSFEASNATWNFPLDSPQVSTPNSNLEDEGFWTLLLKSWVAKLIQANDKVVTHKVVRSGWSLYFTKRMGYLQGTKKQIIAVRLAAQNFMTSLDKNKIEAMLADARQISSAKHTVEIVDTMDSVPSNRDEDPTRQFQHISNTDDSAQHRSSSTGSRHTIQDHAEPSCRFCNRGGHNTFGCPTRRRCDKCHQVGHGVDECQEKLALATDELGGCAFCNADHYDQDCLEIWTSFRPSDANIKRVKNIPAFCYVCGGENHYGSECSLANNGGKATGHTTWSKEIRDLYVDPECDDVAIAWADADLEQLTRKGFHIRGRATRKNHTYFVSSESEDDLIHAPVAKPQARGAIKIASNIGATNGNSRGRDNSHNWQPPLPPGPPPPLVESEQRRSFPPPSSGTMPYQAQTFAHGKQHGRGRGGFHGRGRGRGRGRSNMY
ncbi:hypothetical protein F5B22DRAFT_610701 [Xylaria bambusicola]|uniref:uncharacterized protein n=1 Tax=Xylaria bambusicola TaxID=326684 RepID=UPI002007DE48|nr:uncharacterized protein F5B22DRAFT_610701 [Xylaria bambusicola]KAI0514495.1 hypothetical protein F5B22DRAFT_610701 [Xylaria bambusicola]